jgi:hypothetical protein
MKMREKETDVTELVYRKTQKEKGKERPNKRQDRQTDRDK